MRHRKAQKLANDKAYQLLVEKLPNFFSPLESRISLFLNPETSYDRRINTETRLLNKQIDLRNKEKIESAKRTPFYRVAKTAIDQSTVDNFEDMLEKELKTRALIMQFIPFSEVLNPLLGVR